MTSHTRLLQSCYFLTLLCALAACAPDATEEAAPKGEAPVPAFGGGKADGLGVVQTRGALTFTNTSAGESSAEFEGKGQFHAYTMTLAAGAELSLEITQRGTGRNLDTTLYVYGPRDAQGSYGSSFIAFDDDAGWGALSKISGFRAETAGEYLVLVGTYSTRERGYYRLESRCDNGACLPTNASTTCVFGETYRDLSGGSLAMVTRSKRVIRDVSTLTALEREQLLASVAWTYDEVTTPEEALSVVDGGEINQVELWDASTRRAFVAYEYGAGDNSYGMIVHAGSTQTAAYIQDGDLGECSAFLGEERRLCAQGSDCAAGLSCEGVVEGQGLCVDQRRDRESTWYDASCVSSADCGPISEGLVCAGETGGGGSCLPAWMRRSIALEPYAAIPDNDPAGLTLPFTVFGLASVHTDVLLDMWIDHPAPEELRVTLINPSGTEVVLFDGSASAPGELYARGKVLWGFPGDESVNGTWFLHAVDSSPGNRGTVSELGLELTSRWD